jgi:hypothetical protein
LTPIAEAFLAVRQGPRLVELSHPLAAVQFHAPVKYKMVVYHCVPAAKAHEEVSKKYRISCAITLSRIAEAVAIAEAVDENWF